MKKYNIIIVTPFYKRNKVLKIYLNHLKENQKELWNKIKLHAILIGSKEVPNEEELIKSYNFDYIFHENDYLSDKWNSGIQYIKNNYDFNCILILGSDNIMSSNLIERLYNKLKENYQLCGVQNSYLYDINTKQSAYFPGYSKSHYRYKEIIGAGRIYSKEIIEYLNYKSWDDHLKSSLDYNVLKKIKNIFNIYSTKLFDNEYLMGIKGDGIQLNDFKKIKKCTIPSEDLTFIIEPYMEKN